MLEGTLCCQCGVCLSEKVIDKKLGFSVICDNCYEELPTREKEFYKDRKEIDFL